MTVSDPPIIPANNDRPTPDNKVTVLLVSNVPEDLIRLRHIFQHTNWELLCAQDAEEAGAVLNQRPIPVVLTTPELGGGATWKDLLDSVPTGVRPRVIVTAPDLNDRLWAEVLNLGGYDVLMKPFDHSEVIRIVSLAWLNWRDEATARPVSPGAEAGGETYEELEGKHPRPLGKDPQADGRPADLSGRRFPNGGQRPDREPQAPGPEPAHGAAH